MEASVWTLRPVPEGLWELEVCFSVGPLCPARSLPSRRKETLPVDWPSGSEEWPSVASAVRCLLAAAQRTCSWEQCWHRCTGSPSGRPGTCSAPCEEPPGWR